MILLEEVVLALWEPYLHLSKIKSTRWFACFILRGASSHFLKFLLSKRTAIPVITPRGSVFCGFFVGLLLTTSMN